MKAKKLPSGRWRCQVYLGKDQNGKKIMKSVTADTKKEAEYLAHELLMTRDTADDCMVETAIERYISNRNAVLSPSTIAGYEKLKRNAYGPLNRRMVSQITSEDMQAYINQYAATHSPKSTRNAYGFINSVIRSVRPSVRFDIHLPQKEVIEYHLPTDDDIKRMISECDGELKIAILLASVGTLRRGEICGLKYEDINGNTIHVHSTAVEDGDGNVHYRPIAKTTASDRYIDFPEYVIKEIGSGSGLIVPISPKQLSKRWGRLKRRIKIDVRFHDLRHYAASIMHALGVPDQYIMERGGWSSDAILKSVYRNVLRDKRKEFSDKTNDHFKDMFE